ncbi:MAG TPA: MSMEG_4193 family putative phosphomutase [Candidatus Dormibacteraeota bacterium]|jgi:probable phosphoglycerate mutase|nr:MSMEG_4193 family putative phosphomutase [Candidatus Dormibacteraeota bacterium]
MLLLLIRHGTTGLTAKQLVGRTPGVHLSEAGKAQAERLVGRLVGVPIDHLYSSPLERARETAVPLARGRGLKIQTDARLNECDYGQWTGQEFKALRKTDLWKRVQQRPADARFPGGEALREVQARIVGCIDELAEAHPKETVAAFSHGDVIKAALAHFIGVHLDLFQRIHVAPAAVSALVLTPGGPGLLCVNEVGGLAELLPRRKGRSGQN